MSITRRIVNESTKEKKSYKTSNLPPGTIDYKGSKQTTTTNIEIVNYSKENFTSLNSSSVEDAFNFEGNDHVTWININGLNNVEDIEALGLHYKLHPLTLEDFVNTG
jgi:magnesium transporter